MNSNFTRTILFGVAFTATAVFCYINLDLFYSLKRLSLNHTILLGIISFVSVFANGCQFKCLMMIFGIHLKFHEWVGLTAINSLYNFYVPARGGSVSRAIYLKYHHGFSFSYYISLNAGAYLISFLIASFFSTLFVLAYYLAYDRLFIGVFWLSAVLFLGTIITTFAIIRAIDCTNAVESKGKVWRIVFSVGKGLHFFNKKPKSLGLFCLANTAYIIVTSAKLYIAFLAINLTPNILCIFIVGSLVVFSMIISLTPGNLGIKEGVIGLLASMLGISFEEAILAAVLDRAVTMIVVISLGLIFSYVLLNKKAPEKMRR